MEPKHLLVIEDEVPVRELLVTALTRAGFQVTAATSGEEGLLLLEENRPHLVVLDLILPGMNGLDFCRAIRRDPWMATLPILMLTGRSAEDDMVAGLEVGADDYMTKPFSPKVLTARIKTLLRRAPSSAQKPRAGTSPAVPALLEIRTLGCCELLYAERSICWSELLSPTQRQLLATMLTAADGHLPLEEVQSCLWPNLPASRSRASFDSLMTRLRRLLEQELAPIDVNRHLALRRGILCLENVRVDALEFLRLSSQGIKQLQDGELWGAELAFSAAFSLWQGPFLPGDFGNAATAQLQDRLEQQYIEASQFFARLLAATGRLPEATKQLRSAQRYNLVHDGVVRLLFQLLVAQNHLAQSRQLLERHAELLTRHGFSREEIAAIIAGCSANQPASGGWLALQPEDFRER